MKHQRHLEEARASSAAAIKELEQLQNEKRKMLMEHETQKLRELDDTYGQELREWKGQLKPRKQVRLRLTGYARIRVKNKQLTLSASNSVLLSADSSKFKEQNCNA